jgi:hypothetical protein
VLRRRSRELFAGISQQALRAVELELFGDDRPPVLSKRTSNLLAKKVKLVTYTYQRGRSQVIVELAVGNTLPALGVWVWNTGLILFGGFVTVRSPNSNTLRVVSSDLRAAMGIVPSTRFQQ